MTRLLGTLVALFLATAAQAHEFKVGDLEIGHPNIPMPAAKAMVAAGYLTITNNGTASDTLTAITADFAQMSMVHESKVNADGMATMSAIEMLDIPAGETVSLAPGGLHIMFMGLNAPLAEGTRLPATLSFEKAGNVTVEFKVESAEKAEDHSAHGATN